MKGRGRALALVLIALILVGVALRFTKLGEIPLGMDHDEGHNTLDALQILAGWRPVFLPGNNGREPLFMYLMAASLGLFGSTLWAVRLTGAVAGLLMLPAQYLLTRSLPIPRPRLTALLSAAVVAVTFWPLSKAHQALRAGFLPFWITLMLWAWWRALREDDRRRTKDDGPASSWVHRHGSTVAWSALSGVFIAGAVYTHLTGRTLPLIIVASALFVAVRARRWAPLGYALVALLVALLLSLPQILYFINEPEMIGYRANQASIFNPEQSHGDPLDEILVNARNLALMFNIRGTLSWSENLRGRPIFDPLVGLAFLLGLALLLRDLLGRRGRVPQDAAFLLAFSFGLLMLPSLFSESAPHYGRLTGIWPILFLLPATGLERAAAWLDTRRAALGSVAAAAVLTVSLAWSTWDFFVRYPPAQAAAEHFRAVHVERAQAVGDLVRQGPTYVTPNTWGQSVVRFFNQTTPPDGTFEPRLGLVLPPHGDLRFAFSPGEYEAADEFERRWPEAERTNRRDEQGDWVLLSFHLAEQDFPTFDGPFAYSDHAVFGDNIRLRGHEFKPRSVGRGKPLTVTLDWQALQPTEVDYNFFVHVVAADGRGIGQYDGAPLGGSYLTTVWSPGERVVQTVSIGLAKDAPPGPAVVRVGWYNWRDGERLPVAGDDDAAVDIGQIDIKP